MANIVHKCRNNSLFHFQLLCPNVCKIMNYYLYCCYYLKLITFINHHFFSFHKNISFSFYNNVIKYVKVYN